MKPYGKTHKKNCPIHGHHCELGEEISNDFLKSQERLKSKKEIRDYLINNNNNQKE